MYKKLLFYLIFSFSIAFSSMVSAAPPIPARIGGTLTIDGVQLNQMSDAGYSVKITRINGADYIPAAGDTDGLNASDWYVIDIPTYNANYRPDGASIGETAIIHVYKNGREHTVLSPSKGHIIIGNNGSTTRIDLKVETTK